MSVPFSAGRLQIRSGQDRLTLATRKLSDAQPHEGNKSSSRRCGLISIDNIHVTDLPEWRCQEVRSPMQAKSSLSQDLIAVDSLVCISDDSRNSNFERIANPQKRRHVNRAASFDLLPMASGESESNHILLAVAASPAEVPDSLAKSFEELKVIYHTGATSTFS